jgi:DNA repair exonuclease SbcCD nuclease subunit
VCAKLGLLVLLDADFQALSGQIFPSYDFKRGLGGKIQVKDVVIYGTRYLGERPIAALSKIRKAITKEKGTYNILLQHFGVEDQMKLVQGVPLNILQPLRHRVDYLALGHYHKQFIIDKWIYNPGSAEAVCSSDYFFNRGVFLVEIMNSGRFYTTVKPITLKNRKFVWKSVKNSQQFKKKQDFYDHVRMILKREINWVDMIEFENKLEIPYLFLVLRGIRPFPGKNISRKALESILTEELPIAGARIYPKWNSNLITLENYL